MKFSKIVFTAAGVWGFVILTPLYFLHDTVATARGGPVSYPELFGFLAITVAWQSAFLVIASNPARYRLMMLPAIAEKFLWVITMTVLLQQGRVQSQDMLPVIPDAILGVLFTISARKMATVARYAKRSSMPIAS